MPTRTHDGIKKRCDCGPRRWPKCSHPWYFNFHHGGAHHRYSLDAIARARQQPLPTTKAEAVRWRDTLRGEIRAGTVVDPDAPRPPAPVAGLTVGDVADRYLTDYVGKRETDGAVTYTGQHLRPTSAQQADYQIRLARACEVPAAGGTMRFEQKPIAAVTKADLEAIRTARRPQGVVGCNRLLARLRHVFNWAIGEGFTESHPFKRHGVSVVKLEMSAEAPRTRRLDASATLPDGTVREGEEARLLAHAGPHLRALIVAALSTGCRLGELLSLQWHQIRADEKGEARWIVLPAAKTKTKTARVIPIGPRLRAELTMRRHAIDGTEHPLTAYVFGDEVGGRILSIKRAWEIAVLKAHGHTPVWVQAPSLPNGTRGRRTGRLAPESRVALRAINLHFHDLRRQFACTLLESKADLHDVRDFLGHANITTTSRYVASSPMRLERALARLEGGGAEPPTTGGEREAVGEAGGRRSSPEHSH